jgi:hypothetical protein
LKTTKNGYNFNSFLAEHASKVFLLAHLYYDDEDVWDSDDDEDWDDDLDDFDDED